MSVNAMGRALMFDCYPDETAREFRGGQYWRRRFAIRFTLSQRRKTNVKNTVWAETEPVLLRYFIQHAAKAAAAR